MSQEYTNRRGAVAHVVARGLPTSVEAFEKYGHRRRGNLPGEKGPPYRIFGTQAVYRFDELDSWADAKLAEIVGARKQSSGRKPAKRRPRRRVPEQHQSA
jgi:hypothetical protein